MMHNGLSTRAFNALKFYLCTAKFMPEDVAAIHLSKFKRQPNVGKGTIVEIKAWLRSHGLEPHRSFCCPRCGYELD